MDIIDTLWKSRVREKESVHIGFPFHIAGATTRTVEPSSVIPSSGIAILRIE